MDDFGWASLRVACVKKLGDDKYGRGTWLKRSVSDHLLAMQRHLKKIGADGFTRDDESKQPHLAHVIARGFYAIEIIERNGNEIKLEKNRIVLLTNSDINRELAKFDFYNIEDRKSFCDQSLLDLEILSACLSLVIQYEISNKNKLKTLIITRLIIARAIEFLQFLELEDREESYAIAESGGV